MSQPPQLSRQAYQQLLERFLNGTILPGEMINRHAIAKEFNMSVAPVLEAMVMLQKDGILEAIPGKGTRVRIITARDAVEQRLLRMALECQAARLYCGEPVRQEEDRLYTLAKAIDDKQTPDLTGIQREIAFHYALVTLAGNSRLNRQFAHTARLSLFMSINTPQIYHQRVHRSHANLITALQTKAPGKAETAIRQHFGDIEKHFRKEFQLKESDRHDSLLPESDDPIHILTQHA